MTIEALKKPLACAVVLSAASVSSPAFGQWGGWESLGGIILEQPECVSWSSDRIDCFARGTDRAMYHRWWDGVGWGGWEDLGGIILEQPSCTAWGPNRIDCFARGTNQAMFHRWWDGTNWGGWEDLGGIILEEPECVSWGPDRIDCFARGTDQAMFHRWWDGANWGGWESLGGLILEAPECVTWGPNRIDCFARGTDLAMYHRWWDGANWGGWDNLGGVLLDRPECVTWGPDRIDCFARGTDRALYHRWWDGAAWGGWEDLGGVILEQPSCTAWAANRIDCFARGTDRAMYHRWWDGGSWGGWENLGGIILEEPECVSWGADRIDCFARGTDRAMFHRWWPDNSNVVRSLTISRHNAASLSEADADRILADASTLLQTNDGPGDVACRVALVRSGNVGVFNTGDGSLDTNAELQAVFALPGNVKVVSDVNWCGGGFNTSIIGCGQTPGPSFITERFTPALEGVLWAHEFGHNQGLPHRTDTSDALMFPSIGANRLRINDAECTAFRGGQAGLAVAVLSLPTTTASMGGGTVMPASGNESPNPTLAEMPSEAAMADFVPVEQFVRQIFIEGLPLAQAASYGPEAVSTLVTMLNDPAEALYHENIALTLGMIGDVSAVPALIDFLENAPAEAPALVEASRDRAAFKGRVGAVIGLGYLVNLTGDETALAFLKEHTAPDAWAVPAVEGLAGDAAAEAPTRQDLSRYAVLALGVSGNEEALQHLRELREGTATSDAAFIASINDVVDQSLELNEEIARRGLIDYYRQTTP